MSVDISLSNIGPIVEFEYELHDYGLHVLTGRNGCGKTTTLRAVELATNGRSDVRPAKRDGAPRGEARVAGKTIRIAKKIIEEGDLSIDGCGELSIADLHSPAYRDAVTRDRHRITTLVQLAGVRAEPRLFYDLVGGKEMFDEIVPGDSISTPDLVRMASAVKRAIEREASRYEDRANTLSADARAEERHYEGVDMSVESDEQMLSTKFEQAIRDQTVAKDRRDALTERAEQAREHPARVAAARKKLDEMGAESLGVAEATERLASATEEVDDLREMVARIELQLREVRSDLRAAETARDAAEERLARAKRDAETHVELHAIISSSAAALPSEDEIARADDDVVGATSRVETARKAVTAGLRVRDALAAKERADALNAKAAEAKAQARRLRNAAENVGGVLSDAIATINDCPLRVRISDDGDPRLVVRTDRSESEPFDELSDGLRWGYVMRVAAAENRLVVLPQAAYGELAPSMRERINALAKKLHCYVLTAVAEDCDLRGESYDAISVAEGEG